MAVTIGLGYLPAASSIHRSLVDLSSSRSQAVRIRVSGTFKIWLSLAGFFNITNPSFNFHFVELSAFLHDNE